MAAVLVFGVLLLGLFLGRPDFLWDDVSSIYIFMLLRSFVFSLGQALLSATLSLLFALPMAFAVTQLPQRFRRMLQTAYRLLGLSFFFAPTVVAALSYLQWAMWIDGLPKFGWLPIIFVHVAINVFFLAQAQSSVMLQELAHGARMLEVAHVFGLSRGRAYWNLWARPLRREFLRWLPLVFWWSFSAFTTVLVLGGGPRYSSPEVLLFYLLGAGDRPARLLILILFQVLIGLVALALVRRRQQALQDTSLVRKIPTQLQRPQLGSWSEYAVAALGILIAGVFLTFWIPALVGAARVLGQQGIAWAPLVQSAALAWRALLVGLVLVGLVLAVPARWSRSLGVSLVISPMILVTLSFQWFSLLEASTSLRQWLVAFFCVWGTLPVLALWVVGRRDEITQRTGDLQRVFRPTLWFRGRFLYVPLLGGAILSYVQIVLLGVLGDVGVTSSLLGSAQPTLAQSAYAKISSYQFEAAFSIFGYLMLSLLPLWIWLVFLRQKNEEFRV